MFGSIQYVHVNMKAGVPYALQKEIQAPIHLDDSATQKPDKDTNRKQMRREHGDTSVPLLQTQLHILHQGYTE